MRPCVYVTQRIPEPAIELLRTVADVEVNPDPDRVLPRPELLEAVRTHDYILAQLTNKVDAEFLDANPSLEIVANMAVGYDNIDLVAATARGVMASNTPGVLTETTADLAWALMMAVARRIVESDKFLRAGKWTAWGPMLLLGRDVYGKTLGIVGCGRIGQAVARRAIGFQMRTIYYDEVRLPEATERDLKLTYLPLDEVLATADFVTVHTPLMPSTYHLFDEARLRRMKPTAILVNAARGPIVDEKALARALKEGWIAGAGLDVYEREPAVEPELLGLDNAVLVPHIGSATLETRTKMAVLAAENIVAAIKGERPPTLLNPEAMERRGTSAKAWVRNGDSRLTA